MKMSVVFSNNSNKVAKKFKDYVEKLIKDKNDLIIIVKHYNSNEMILLN